MRVENHIRSTSVGSIRYLTFYTLCNNIDVVGTELYMWDITLLGLSYTCGDITLLGLSFTCGDIPLWGLSCICEITYIV